MTGGLVILSDSGSISTDCFFPSAAYDAVSCHIYCAQPPPVVASTFQDKPWTFPRIRAPNWDPVFAEPFLYTTPSSSLQRG